MSLALSHDGELSLHLVLEVDPLVQADLVSKGAPHDVHGSKLPPRANVDVFTIGVLAQNEAATSTFYEVN